MKVIFALPRFHTNQIPIISFFLQRGHCVNVNVADYGFTEMHTVDTVRFRQSIFSRLLAVRGPNRPEYIPSLRQYIPYLFEYRPSLVISRYHCLGWCILLALLKPIIGYKLLYTLQISNQVFAQSITYASFIRKPLKLLSIRAITFLGIKLATVIPESSPNLSDPSYLTYLPFLPPASNYDTRDPKVSYDLLSIGKMRPRKKHDDLVRAVHILHKKFQLNLNCLIVGECKSKDELLYLRDLLQLIEILGLSNSFQLLLNVPHEKTLMFYKTARLFVLAAVNEPASISIIEALGEGVSVICTEQCGTASYIQDAATGFIVPPNNPVVLARAINSYLLQINYNQINRPHVRGLFSQLASQDIYAQQLYKLFPNLSF